jgi:predicted dehydrogenase
VSNPADKLVRVAFLGVDESTPELLRVVLENPRFELAGICGYEQGAAGTAEWEPEIGHLRTIPDWEMLLEDQQIEAVIVARGGDEDQRTEQLRKLVQVDKAVLASQPVVDSMLVYYELDMIRRDTSAPLVPRLALRKHPAVQALAEIVRQGESSPIGKVEQLSVERCLPSPVRQFVLRQFARDVDLVRAIAGDMTRLGASAGAPGSPNFATLSVQMHGPAGIDARWAVVPIQAAVGVKVTLTGSRGRASIELVADDAPWTMETIIGQSTERQEFPGWDFAAAELERFVEAIDQRAVSPDWVDACRAVELTETIERSLKKSRTLELYYEDYTEDATFKGTMASLGCGLLVMTVLLLALVGVAEQMKIPHLAWWRYLLVVVLIVFLLLQLVMLTSGKDKRREDTASGNGNGAC